MMEMLGKSDTLVVRKHQQIENTTFSGRHDYGNNLFPILSVNFKVAVKGQD
jgi:hypothetical protein